MSILYVVIVLIIVGLLLWIINSLIPMEPTIKRIVNIVVIVFTIIWLLKVVGFWSYLIGVKV